jgi:hypothetical protein
MTRNAVNASGHLQIPPKRVAELGTRGIVRYFPPGGMGSLKTPYLKSGAPSRNCAIAQMPKFCLDAAMERHAVLIFRDQPLSDEQQLAFTLQFGQLER